MSKISTAICRSFLLWWHLGIGPLIGAGPMQARPGRSPVVPPAQTIAARYRRAQKPTARVPSASAPMRHEADEMSALDQVLSETKGSVHEGAALDAAHVGDIHGAFGTIRRDDHGPRSTGGPAPPRCWRYSAPG